MGEGSARKGELHSNGKCMCQARHKFEQRKSISEHRFVLQLALPMVVVVAMVVLSVVVALVVLQQTTTTPAPMMMFKFKSDNIVA